VIGLDTNVLVRYLAQDDEGQARAATTLLESLTVERPGFVSQVVIVELVWVLSGAYRIGRVRIGEILDELLRTQSIVVEQAATVWRALRLFTAANTDFADCLIERSAAGAGCERTVTFDRAAARGCGMVLLR